jgi:hypothetical protein
MTWNLNTHVVTECSTCSLLPTGPKSLYQRLQEVTKRNTLLCLPDTGWSSRWHFGLRTCSFGQLALSSRLGSDFGSWIIASSHCVIMCHAVKKRLASAIRVHLANSRRSAISRSNFWLKQAILGSSMASSVCQGNTTEEGCSYSDAIGWLLARSSAGVMTIPTVFLIFFSRSRRMTLWYLEIDHDHFLTSLSNSPKNIILH